MEFKRQSNSFLLGTFIFAVAFVLWKRTETDTRSQVLEGISQSLTDHTILCLVMTRPSSVDLQNAIVQTWGAKCNDLLFLIGNEPSGTSILNKRHGQSHIFDLHVNIRDEFDNTWNKIRVALKFLNKSWTKEFDWILRIDDDSYVVFDNLRSFLSNYSHTEPIQFGSHCRTPNEKVEYITTGPGIVLSSAAFKLVMNIFATEKCSKNVITHADDVQLAKCLKSAGVPFGNSSDSNRRLRFIAIKLNDILYHPESDAFKYLKKASVYPLQLGMNCCSEDLISWHYVNAEQMFLYHKTVTLLQQQKKEIRLSSFNITP